MSKAFAKDEGEGSTSAEVELDPLRDLPAGAKNYMTRQGFETLKQELAEIAQHQGESAVRRARYLDKVLQSADVVDSQSHSGHCALFGAHVTVRDEESRDRTYQIVGIHEADPPAGKISWTSPVAKTLLNKRVGEEVILRTPNGEEAVEIIAVTFK